MRVAPILCLVALFGCGPEETADPVVIVNVGTQGEGKPTDTHDPAECPCDAAISKAPIGEFVAGEVAQWEVVVDFSGAEFCDLEKLCFDDDLPAGQQVIANSPGWDCSMGGTVECCLTDFDSTDVGRYTVVLDVLVPADSDQGEVKNCVSMGHQDANEENNYACATAYVQPPKKVDLAVDKQAEGPFVGGSSASFFFKVSNNGDSDVNQPVLIDTLPSGIHFVDQVISDWDCVGNTSDPQTVTCTYLGVLAAGDAVSFSLPVTLDQEIKAEETENCATVASSFIDVNPQDNTSCVGFAVEAGKSADIKIEKTVLGEPVAGGVVEFSLAVTNGGPDDAMVTVVDTLPMGHRFVDQMIGMWDCTTDGGSPETVTCVATSVLPANQTDLLILPVFVDEQGAAENCAEASSTLYDPNEENNRSCVVYDVKAAPQGDLSIIKEVEGELQQGESGAFNFLVINAGPDSVTGVQVTDTLPVGYSMADQVSGNFTCVGDNNQPETVVCSYMGVFAPGSDSFTLQVDLDQDVDREGVNCADVVSELPDPNMENNSSCVTFDVKPLQLPDLVITKSVNDGVVFTGTENGFTFTVENHGVDADNVVLTDVLPAGHHFTNQVIANWDCVTDGASPETVTCTYLGVFAAGMSSQFVLPVDVDEDVEGEGLNCASVDSDRTDLNPEDNQACVSYTFSSNPEVCGDCVDNDGDGLVDEECDWDVSFHGTGDNKVTVYMDGALVANGSTDSDLDDWSRTSTNSTVVSTGQHTMSVTVHNITGPHGLTASAVVQGQNGSLVDYSTGDGVWMADYTMPVGWPLGTAGLLAEVPCTRNWGVSSGNPTLYGASWIGMVPSCNSTVSWTSGGSGYTVGGTGGSGFVGTGTGGGTTTGRTFSNEDHYYAVTFNTCPNVDEPVSADLELSKTVLTAAAAPGVGEYTMQITNYGPTDATTVVMTDVLPAGVTFDDQTFAEAACVGDNLSPETVTCTVLNPMAVGDIVSFALPVNVDSTLAGVEVENCATVSSATPDPVEVNNSSCATMSVGHGVFADLAIVKTMENVAYVGDTTVANFEISNLGASDAVPVVIDSLPLGLQFVDQVIGDYDCVGNGMSPLTVTCTRLSPLAAGATETLSLPLFVGDEAIDSLENCVTVHSDVFDPALDNNGSCAWIEVMLPSANLSIQKEAGELVEGGAGFFTFSISNFGPNVATDVSFTDVLPAGITFDDQTVSGWTCVGDDQDPETITCTFAGTLPVGSSVIDLDVLVAINTEDNVNCATVTSTTADPDLTDNTGCTDFTVIQLPRTDLSVIKTLRDGVLPSNGTGAFDFEVHNAGEDALDVVLVDTLPQGITFVDQVIGNWSCVGDTNSPQTVTCTFNGVFAAGAYEYLTLPVNISGQEGGAENCALVSSSTLETDPTNNSSCVGYEYVPGGEICGDCEDNDFDGLIDEDCEWDVTFYGTADNRANVYVDGSLIASKDAGDPLYDSAMVSWATNASHTVTVPTGTHTMSVYVDNISGPHGLVATALVTGENGSQETYLTGDGSWKASSGNAPVGWPTAPLGMGGESVCTRGWGTGSAPYVYGAVWIGLETTCQTAVYYGGDQYYSVEFSTCPNVDLTPVANLSITKEFLYGTVGADGEFSLSVYNDGPDDAPDVVVTDLLPPGVHLIGSNNIDFDCVTDGGAPETVTCSLLTTLVSGDSQSVDLLVSFDDTAELSDVNCASVISETTTDELPEDDDICIDYLLEEPVLTADLWIQKVLKSDVIPGQQATWELTVTNDGPGDSTGLIVTDTLPLGMLFSSSGQVGDWWCQDAGGYPMTVECFYTDPLTGGQLTLASGQSTTISLPVSVIDEVFDGENCADVISETPDSNPENNFSCAPYVVTNPEADLSINKSLMDDAVLGSTTTFKLEVTADLGSASQIIVTDQLPSGFSFVSASSSGVGSWTCTGDGGVPETVSCLFSGVLNELDVSTIEIVVSVDEGGGPATNCAKVQSTYDINPGNDNSCVDFDVQQPCVADLPTGMYGWYSNELYSVDTSTGAFSATGVTLSTPGITKIAQNPVTGVWYGLDGVTNSDHMIHEIDWCNATTTTAGKKVSEGGTNVKTIEGFVFDDQGQAYLGYSTAGGFVSGSIGKFDVLSGAVTGGQAVSGTIDNDIDELFYDGVNLWTRDSSNLACPGYTWCTVWGPIDPATGIMTTVGSENLAPTQFLFDGAGQLWFFNYWDDATNPNTSGWLYSDDAAGAITPIGHAGLPGNLVDLIWMP